MGAAWERHAMCESAFIDPKGSTLIVSEQDYVLMGGDIEYQRLGIQCCLHDQSLRLLA